MQPLNIEYRSIRPSDYPALEAIIKDTWEYEKFCSPKAARAMSKIYLAACLANQTFTCVAVRDGEPVGIIMGKDERTYRATLRQNIRLFAAMLPSLMRSESRKLMKYFSTLEKINNDLFARCTRKFGGELAFFAVRGDQRGTGIGQALFDRLQDYMKSVQITDYYLYTDTTCNFGFYEHQGMQRLCEQKWRLPARDEEMFFYLYATAPSN